MFHACKWVVISVINQILWMCNSVANMKDEKDDTFVNKKKGKSNTLHRPLRKGFEMCA